MDPLLNMLHIKVYRDNIRNINFKTSVYNEFSANMRFSSLIFRMCFDV